MKGGATSGIVYPKAVLALAKDYRFRSIGGASAGAVAAAITAAAEYGRAAGGFERIAAIPAYISGNLAIALPTGREGDGHLRRGRAGRAEEELPGGAPASS